MSAMQRRKGASGEREWCTELKAHGFQNAERCLAQSRAGGGDVPVPPVLWEVKRRAKNIVYSFLEQANTAVKQYPGCEIPAVALRADAKPWLVVMQADDFFALLRRVQLEALK